MYSDKKGVRALCYQLKSAGITDVVISPGSRHAPIIQTLFALKGFTFYSIPDERVAAFFALGLAQSSNQVVTIVTTSGTAVLNLSPGIAEAYYRHIPLLIITGDRPAKWIDNGDGQSINQVGVFRNFIYKDFTLPQDLEYEDQYNETRLYESLRAVLESKGPVHINIPMDEPLYNFQESIEGYEDFVFPDFELKNLHSVEVSRLIETINRYDKIMIVVGQNKVSTKLIEHLDRLKDYGFVVINEHIANVASQDDLYLFDLVLAHENDSTELRPELVIQIGGAIVSKRLKKFLRRNRAKDLIFIDPMDQVPDVFECLSWHLKFNAEDALEHLQDVEKSPSYSQAWHQAHKRSYQHINQLKLEGVFSDFSVFSFLMSQLPDVADIHLGNSSVIRYAQLFRASIGRRYYSNRGVSGIDGCTSTALGHAFHSDRKNFLIVGDVSFFYDSNAFWMNPSPKNLGIILINNGGGNIFSLIEGPSNSDIMEDFQITPHQLSAKAYCNLFDIDYFSCRSMNDLSDRWIEFLGGDDLKLIEIFTDRSINDRIFKQLNKLK